MAIFAVPVAVVVLLSVPQMLRDRRLNAAGSRVLATCTERLYLGGSTVRKVRCTFPTASGGVARALVTAPVPAPEVGQEFEIAVDPRNPKSVESSHYLNSPLPRVGYFAAGLLAVMVIAVAVLLVFF
ncbi:hypothetical protein [Streptomyces sp. NPDC048438]|uniref:hypothetical protein n=1 Tax=Streptomyces sp. NPDC048438 TaxID=3365551 RepID=UPI0037224958